MTNQKTTIFPFSLSKIIQLEENLSCNIMPKYIGHRLVGQSFIDFIDHVHSVMPKVVFSVLSKSLQYLAGIAITKDLASELTWRLAGNQHHLKCGMIVPPYSSQPFPEWVPVQVMDIQRKKRKRYSGDKKDGNVYMADVFDLDLFVMGGLPSGKRFVKTCTDREIYNKTTKRMFGFSHYDRRLYDRYFIKGNNYPFKDIRQLVRMRFFVLMDPAVSKVGEIVVKEMSNTGTCQKWNRELIKRRERDTFPCLMNYDPRMVPCHKCEIGYDKCSAGCHSRTYFKKYCPDCQKESYFEQPLALCCVDCLVKTA